MNLEEIESRLGSLIQAHTVSQLKSTVWKEILEGSELKKEEIEQLVIQLILKEEFQNTAYSTNAYLTLGSLAKQVLQDILKCIGDNKKHMGECTLATLDSWKSAVKLDKMVPYITTAVMETKLGADGDRDFFDWLTMQLSALSDFNDASAMTDKSSDVRKAAEACIADILTVSGHDSVVKNLKDIQGPALALVLEQLKPYGSLQVHTGPTSKSIPKVGIPASNGVSKPGNKATSSRGIALNGSRQGTLLSAQDMAVQSQALINDKDSTKVSRHDIIDKSIMGMVLQPYPHLFCNNFRIKLLHLLVGERTTNFLKHLSPVPTADGKLIITFSNYQDYISFRNHVYEKHGGPISIVKEIGPHFEMKLYKRHVYRGKGRKFSCTTIVVLIYEGVMHISSDGRVMEMHTFEDDDKDKTVIKYPFLSDGQYPKIRPIGNSVIVTVSGDLDMTQKFVFYIWEKVQKEKPSKCQLTASVTAARAFMKEWKQGHFKETTTSCDAVLLLCGFVRNKPIVYKVGYSDGKRINLKFTDGVIDLGSGGNFASNFVKERLRNGMTPAECKRLVTHSIVYSALQDIPTGGHVFYTCLSNQQMDKVVSQGHILNILETHPNEFDDVLQNGVFISNTQTGTYKKKVERQIQIFVKSVGEKYVTLNRERRNIINLHHWLTPLVIRTCGEGTLKTLHFLLCADLSQRIRFERSFKSLTQKERMNFSIFQDVHDHGFGKLLKNDY